MTVNDSKSVTKKVHESGCNHALAFFIQSCGLFPVFSISMGKAEAGMVVGFPENSVVLGQRAGGFKYIMVTPRKPA
jgi:hypothetical protein